MSVVRRIQIGENHKSAEVLNRPSDDIQTLSGLTLGETFPGFARKDKHEQLLTGSSYAADGSDFAGFVKPTDISSTVSLSSDRIGRDAGVAYAGEVGVTDVRYPVGDVRRYGYVSGSDATTAFQRAIAYAQASGCRVHVPGGTYILSSTLIDVGGAVVFDMAGPEQTILRWNGTTGSFVFSFTLQRTMILGGCKIISHTGDWKYNGIAFSGAASRCRIEEVFCYRPDTGVRLTSVFGNLFLGLNIYQAQTRGIDLVSLANSNIFICKEISGNSVASSRGISINGEANVLTGNQLSGFDTNLHQETGWANRVEGFYNENAVTYNINLVAGSLEYTSVAVTHRTLVAAGALLITSAGKGLAPGVGHQPAKRLPAKGLTAFYPMHEAAGTTLRDYSGNRRSATIVNPTWVTGPFGDAVQLDTTGGITLSTASITYNAAWTVALLVNVQTYGASGSRVIILSDGAGGTIALTLIADSTTTSAVRNGSTAGNLTGPFHTTGHWQWLFVSYDGSTTITQRHPSMIGYPTPSALTVALANPLTTLTQLSLHGSGSGTVQYGGISIWDHELTADEALDWTNRPANVIPIQAAPFVLSPSITPISVAAQTVARQTFTVTGLLTTDTITVNPPSASGSVGLGSARVSATNQLELTFINPTAGALTPTAGTYTVTVSRL